MSEMIKFPTLVKTGLIQVVAGQVMTALNGDVFTDVTTIAELWSNGTVFANVTDKYTGVKNYRRMKADTVEFVETVVINTSKLVQEMNKDGVKICVHKVTPAKGTAHFVVTASIGGVAQKDLKEVVWTQGLALTLMDKLFSELLEEFA